MYVIKRVDQGGGYVSPPGSQHSYVKDLAKAKIYPTKEAAEKELCVENEIIVNVNDFFQRQSST